MARRKSKTALYLALAAAAWWYYQKQKGNNFMGQPLIAAPANPAATPAAVAAQIAAS